MRRLHAIAISILLGAGIAAGAAASLTTVRLGAAAATTPTSTVLEKTIAARRAKLARWSTSLAKARTAKPPALPGVPHYAPVPIPTMPSIQTAATPPMTTTPVREVVEGRAAVATTARTHARPQVTYVQPSPIVQYRQATAPPTTTAAGGEHEDGYGDDRSEPSEQESAQGGDPAKSLPGSADGTEGDG